MTACTFFEPRYMHWNHQVLPHWDKKTSAKYPEIGKIHNPDRDDLGSSFFPRLGPYSSSDPDVLREHFLMMERAGIGVAVVSWLPKERHDDSGPPIAERLGQILDVAVEYDVRIAVHMEPYDDRNLTTLKRDVVELLDLHGNAPALYRMTRRPRAAGGDVAGIENNAERLLPVLYFYDQYRLPASLWEQLLGDDNSGMKNKKKGCLRGCRGKDGSSIRGTKYDVVALALIVDEKHWKEYVQEANFDGGYTYFAADTFTYGSNPRHWEALQQHAIRDGKVFVPSVGPGYDDTRIRPWNFQITKQRQAGRYFDREWEAAIRIRPDIVSVTSFNEWHEGKLRDATISETS